MKPLAMALWLMGWPTCCSVMGALDFYARGSVPKEDDASGAITFIWLVGAIIVACQK